ncbi:MAG: ATP phosphoribosyltransferase regulatory subunit [Lachnospiraceae bacterium]|nr:ATP phosphoribosyltransferase regulatory subunit [Lachnospiraceae bacterium]
MDKKILHTPEGVRDIYGDELKKKLELQVRLLDILHKKGYEDINTPSFEFFDVFSSDIGTTPSNELFKFFDKDGNTLVLRPDFTPSIARCVAKYHMDASDPLKFSYCGSTFTNTSDYQGRLKETTQIGAELINDDSSQADADIIETVISALKSLGLEEFQITIGNVEYFKGLCNEYGISNEDEMKLRKLISNKNFFMVKEILEELDIKESGKENILKIGDMFGSIDEIESTRANINNERSKEAILRLEEVYGILKNKGLDEYVCFDLGMLSKYNYYTGMVFSAYTYGTGDAIVKGGRYDNLLEKFGKKAAAIGFAVVVDRLLNVI